MIGSKRVRAAIAALVLLTVLLAATTRWHSVSTRLSPAAPFGVEPIRISNPKAVEEKVLPVLETTKEEEGVEYPIVAYLIMAHTEDTMRGTALLIEELSFHKSLFAIHIDSAVSEEDVGSLKERFAGRNDIIYVEDRIQGSWGDYSLVQMELNLIRDALKSSIPWEMAFVLDGSTWVTKSAPEREEWLKTLPPNSSYVIPSNPKPICTFGPSAEESYLCVRTPARCTDESCTAMTLTPGGRIIYTGASQWVRLSRDFARYALEDPAAAEWQAFWRDQPTRVADEHFFSTVFMHSPFKDTADFNYPMYTDWRNECKSHRNQRPGNSPCYMGVKDLPSLRNFRGIFARKWWSDEPARDMILAEEVVQNDTGVVP
jgi:hypothetical protein